MLIAAASKFPTPPDAISAQVGWWGLAMLLGFLVHVCARAEWWRRFILGREDPRVFAVLRIGLAACVLQNFWNLAAWHGDFLWSDEGLFSMAEARTRLGAAALLGWSEVDGFYDGWALVRFFWGKHSLLFLHGSPAFVRGYLVVFFAALVLYGIGFRTRLMGLLSYLLMMGLYARNGLYFEGTDTVYKCVFFVMLFARTDAAWSVDNWLRRKREQALADTVHGGATDTLDWWRALDRLGHLATALGIAAAFGVLAPVPSGYWEVTLGLTACGVLWAGAAMVVEAKLRHSPRPAVRFVPVPRWPRLLLMVQVAAIYTATGAQKTGSVWRKGDALYYALNMDHFYRFEGVTQRVSAVVGTNLFRVATWVTHYWEILFPVLLIGMVLHFADDHRERGWAIHERAIRWRVWLGTAGLVLAWFALYRAVGIAAPYSVRMVDGEIAPSIGLLRTVDLVFLVIIPAFVLLRVVLRLAPIRVGRVVFDHRSLRSWVVGRRVWLTLGVVFHGFLIAFMNIGMFPFIMLWTYVAFTDSRPWVWLVRGEAIEPDDGTRPLERPIIVEPHRLVGGAWNLAAWAIGRRTTTQVRRFFERARHRDPRWPDWVVAAFALGIVWILVAKGLAGPEAIEGEGTPYYDAIAKRWWKIALAVGAACALLASRDRRDLPRHVGAGPSLVSSTLARTAALGLFVFHTLAIVTTIWPDHPVYDAIRDGANEATKDWRKGTHTTQSWRMFAPNPPRSNTFLQTVVVTQDGARYDLRNNALHDRPNPWIFNDRMRKMQRRVAGKGRWYRRYWGAYHCRQWTLEHGEAPVTVEMYKLHTKIPPPEEVAERGPYVPTELRVHETLLQKVPCSGKGELSPEIKLRRGLPLTDKDRSEQDQAYETMLRGLAGRRRAWRRRKTFGGPDPTALESVR